jgi:hypothetical protein
MTAVVVALALVLSAICGRAQSLPATNLLSTLVPANRWTAAKPPTLLLPPALPLNLRGPLTNPLPQLLVLARTNSPSIALPLKPGVYKTEPFSCLVIVPGAQADDQAIIGPSEPVPPMPMIKPDLRFVPWSAASTRTNFER